MNKKNQDMAEYTASKISTAAKALFVNQGFAATSMSQIAKKAGVTQSLIHHHFTRVRHQLVL